MKTSKLSFLLLLILGFATLAIHTYLSMQHYNLKLGLGAGPSICNVSATFNCDGVAASRYAQFLGIPIAILGAVTQLILMVFVMASQWDLSSNSHVLRRFVFWIALFVAGISLVMGSISTFALSTYCLFCMAAYLLSWIYLFFAWKFQDSNPFKTLGEDVRALFGSLKWALLLLIAIPVMGYVANGVVLDSYGFGKMDLMIQDSLANWDHAPVYEFKKDQGLVLNESPAPKMVIVEFADFLCPHCKMAYPVLHAFAQGHKDVQLIFKSFPLDAKCNKGLTHEGDGYRCKLAGLVVCSEKLGKKGWDAHHWIFDRQETLNSSEKLPELTAEFAKSANLSAEELTKCLDEVSTMDAILAMGAEGTLAKIQGTPTVFVNGKQLERGQFMPILDGLYKKLSQ